MFQEIIRQLRKESGLSQEKVARACDISKQQYCRFEWGQHKPGYDTLIRLAECFHVSLDYLTERTDVRENPHVPSTIQNKLEK